MNNYFVGVDLGTGSTKAIGLAIDGTVLCTAQFYYTTNNPQPGFSEQNPCLIWDAFVSCINIITAKVGYGPSAISFSAAMHSILPVNRKGEPLAYAILWSDARSGEIAQNIRNSTQGENIYRHTGTAIYAMSPLCKLIWMRENQINLFNIAYKFISIKEYIWHRLFGVFEVDYSIASATGLFDILDLEWFADSLLLAGISSEKLSAPVNTGHKRFLSAVNNLLEGVTTATAFIIGASDGCCANLGGGAVGNGIAALTIGTSGAIRVGSEVPVYNYRAMTFNYLLNKNTFICGGAVNNGGAAVDWLLKSFLKITNVTDETYTELFADITTIKPGSDGLIFLPYLYAERAPVWDAKSSAAFLNVNFTHQQSHFLRAALEGICFALCDVMKAIETPEQPIKEVVISGGFISSPVWVQMLADITGKKLVIQQADDASAVGAIYLAMEALGLNVSKINEDAQDRIEIEPDAKNHETYSRIFAVYQTLYRNLKESMHLMHDLNN
jgi:gluconokinase